MYYFRIIILFPLLVLTSYASASPNFKAIKDSLNHYLSEKEHYFLRQTQLIESEEENLLHVQDPRQRFEICYRIFNLSRSYKYKIAYQYADEALRLAQNLEDPNLITLAIACKISTFTSAGLFTEATDLINNLIPQRSQLETKRELYYNIIRHYSDHLDYVYNTEYELLYTERIQAYTDSLIQISPQKDYYYIYARAYQLSTQEKYEEAIKILTDYHESHSSGDHHESIVTFLLGYLHFQLDHCSEGFHYMALSVKHDIKSATMENRSIKTMAEKLFDHGELEMAEKMIHTAFEDANFYGARHRNLEINTLLPIINQQRINTVSRERNFVYAFSAILFVLGIILLIFMLIARKRAQQVHDSQAIIQKQIKELRDMNQELIEASNIKEHYIIESLYKKNENLEQIESLLKKIDIKVKNKLYEDLRFLHKEVNLKRQRDNFFTDFDTAFLKLFPNFIEEYNRLFNPEDHIDISNTNTLPAEVRIMALMRLGITENERISKFLNLSINTIYTYKTKVKNRSIISNDEFENYISEIRLTPHS